MQCTRCKADNEALQKFCNSCGAPLGILCDRCGSINGMEARHCGTCGQALVASLKQEGVSPAPVGKARIARVRQYTLSEIEELLLLRKAMKAEEESTKIMNQHDIDNLFE